MIDEYRICPVCFQPASVTSDYHLPFAAAREGYLLLHWHCWAQRIEEEPTYCLPCVEGNHPGCTRGECDCACRALPTEDDPSEH